MENLFYMYLNPSRGAISAEIIPYEPEPGNTGGGIDIDSAYRINKKEAFPDGNVFFYGDLH